MKANSHDQITEAAEQGIRLAAERLGAKVNDVRGHYLAGSEWDADTAEELADLICECWNEQS